MNWVAPLDRALRLGDEILARIHCAPSPGAPMLGDFSVPPARNATAPLTRKDLVRGLGVLSRLPKDNQMQPPDAPAFLARVRPRVGLGA